MTHEDNPAWANWFDGRPAATYIDSYDKQAPVPHVGTDWIWEPDKPHAREGIRVTTVRWNGEEWWIGTTVRGAEYWNDLSRFWEAVGADVGR